MLVHALLASYVFSRFGDRQGLFFPLLQNVDPLVVSLSTHFDIVVKTVYASYYLNGHVPGPIRTMYVEHERVWNGFKEGCMHKYKHPRCRPGGLAKNGEADFVSSFNQLIHSMAKNGFDRRYAVQIVPKYMFAITGAHRTATAIALKLPDLPVLYKDTTIPADWGFRYFFKLKYKLKYADHAVLEFARIVNKTRFAIVWPAAVQRGNVGTARRELQNNRCTMSGIIYERAITLQETGIENILLHLYGEAPWLSLKAHQVGHGALHLFVFVERSIKSTLACKDNVRKRYGVEPVKNAIHTPDNHAEALDGLRMLLNPVSRKYLDKSKGARACWEVSKELKRRDKLHISKIMVDSGAAMAFWGLRKMTDVDLLFVNKVYTQLLGSSNGMEVQAHRLAHNHLRGSKDWGAAHVGGSVKDHYDLFYDPANFGYCGGGLKFVSPAQLIRYKSRRNEPGKDTRDVKLLRSLMQRDSILFMPMVGGSHGAADLT